jgi:hypothetical protein
MGSSSRPRESSIKERVIDHIKVAYPGAQVRKRHGTAFATAGDPDVYALIGGCHLELELKVPGQNATPLQAARLLAWQRAGAHVAVIHSVVELSAFLRGLAEEGVLPPPASPA